MRQVAVFGWGLVAPQAPNIRTFVERLDQATSWLEPFNGFGPDNFMVGKPAFDFTDYQQWIERRFPPNRFRQLQEKMDSTTLYAVGAFIQALEQNPALEETLSGLRHEAHIYVSTALGAIPTLYATSLEHYRAQRRWNRFWAAPERNHLAAQVLTGSKPGPEGLTDPSTVDDPDSIGNIYDHLF